MPMMDLTLPAGALGPDKRATLVDGLTSALLKAERAPVDNEFFRAITWVFVHELADDAIYTAGRPVPEPIVRLEVTTPEGALSDRRRTELVAEATALIGDAVGIADDDVMRIWVICREVPEGSWGAGGQIVEFEKLREASAAAKLATALEPAAER